MNTENTELSSNVKIQTSWDKLRILAQMLASIATVSIPIIVAVVGSQYTQVVKEREVQGRFVELSLDILRTTASDNKSEPLREWATQVINRYSGVPLSADAQSLLRAGQALPASSSAKANPPQAVDIPRPDQEIMQKLLRLTEIGKSMANSTFRNVYIANGVKVGEDTSGITIPMPFIAQNPAYQTEWNSLRQDIVAATNTVRPELFTLFQDIDQFVQQHPWPRSNTVVEVENSGWSNGEIIGAWLSRNDRLSGRVQYLMNQPQ